MVASLSSPSFSYFDQMTSVSISDIPLFLAVCAGYYCYRHIITNGPLTSMGRALRVKRLHKFVHRSFDALHYLVCATIGVLALAPREYGHCFAYAKNCRGLMYQNPEGFILTVAEKSYFLLFFAYYAVDLAFLGTASDRLMMVIHHIVTLSEVGACVVLQSPVVALSIMLLHDITDVPLYVAKFFVYVRIPALATFFLALFAASVTYFRIVNYPIIVYIVAAVGWGTKIHPVLYAFETSCLGLLYVLHLIWERKILQHVAIAVSGREQVRDRRSDSE
jgi:hypothetical protein